MDDDLPRRLVAQRRNHPAWLLLASRNAPLTLACLQSLVDGHPGGLAWDDAVEQLAALFAVYANDPDFDLGGDENHSTAARRELRQWLRRGLIVERNGLAIATDALQRSLAFLSSLEERAMTSTASRLATVQREIGELEARLNPSQSGRARSLKEKIGILEEELAAVDRGEFEVLEGGLAEEGIREVYQLAESLRADFRRVEDSYREADLALRQRIIGEEVRPAWASNWGWKSPTDPTGGNRESEAAARGSGEFQDRTREGVWDGSPRRTAAPNASEAS